LNLFLLLGRRQGRNQGEGLGGWSFSLSQVKS